MARRKSTKKIISSTIFYIFVAGIATVIVLPIYFLVSISFMSDQEAYDWPIAMAPAFSNTFLLQKSDNLPDGFLMSVYSKSQEDFINISEANDLDKMINFIDRKTGSKIPKKLLEEKISELETLVTQNEERINELKTQMKREILAINRLNREIVKIHQNLKLFDPEDETFRELRENLQNQLQEKQQEKILVEEKIKTLKKELQSISGVTFKVRKNIFASYITFFRVTSDSVGALIRSIQVALLTVLISLTIGGMAGYAFARYVFKGKNLLKLSVLFVRMFPGIAIAMPMVIILAQMGFYDKPIGLSLVYSVGQIGMTTWITASIFMGISVELEEAAQVFGTSRLGAFLRVTLPLALPGLAASAMYAFIGSWSETAQAIVLTQFKPTFPVVIYQTLVGTKGMINLVAAGGVTLAFPAVLFTMIIRRYILQMWGGVRV
ncbi:carbohydrate ABC transporter permease [Kosmotoga sp. DU53]|uniref:carbohydrate ABC transporter permease n=1 Tax=Kosmotoga sp. DU53 TaxID=1310160 RepID=UPI0007C5B647|nr:carbohydrate ABC transporter permease [Kosmotoga sp. DU53]MDK2953738.1 multiple sugar transport system permease protein [Kosmotoga sp.]OAA20936.1 ABC transporter permease [Kosmotoga sp. DU53]